MRILCFFFCAGIVRRLKFSSIFYAFSQIALPHLSLTYLSRGRTRVIIFNRTRKAIAFLRSSPPLFSALRASTGLRDYGAVTSSSHSSRFSVFFQDSLRYSLTRAELYDSADRHAFAEPSVIPFIAPYRPRRFSKEHTLRRTLGLSISPVTWHSDRAERKTVNRIPSSNIITFMIVSCDLPGVYFKSRNFYLADLDTLKLSHLPCLLKWCSVYAHA